MTAKIYYLRTRVLPPHLLTARMVGAWFSIWFAFWRL